MKNRKTAIVAFLLVAAMLLGVGYAALSDTLYVNGTMTLADKVAEEAFEKEVYFTTAAKSNTEDADSAAIDATDNDKATFTVGSLKAVKDEVTFTYTIKNDNDFAVKVTVNTNQVSGTNCFTVTPSESVIVEGNQTATVTVKVVLASIPTDGATQNGTYVLTYDVVPNT